tara:strand:- start:1156 stop:1770 length:615 start_codon:yes stop_codon:yes gene_type:complete
MNNNLKNHWENIYEKKNEDEVSWFQQIPNSSIKLIKSTGIVNPKIIDVGSGRSKLLKSLIDSGYNDLTYLDISEAALKKSKEFLGDQSNKVKWIAEDILNFKTEVKFDVWHDRAVFHFLTEQNLIDKYVELVSKNISNSGHLIIGTFSENGPLKCSGLNVNRYSKELIEETFLKNFRLINTFHIDHKTPFNTTQNFLFSHFIKN